MTAYSELGKIMTNDITMPLREKMVLRRLMYVNRKYRDKSADSVQSYEASDLSDALIQRKMPDDTIFRDGLRTATSTVLMNTIVEGFKIERQEFDNYMMNGIPIDNSMAMIAAKKVAEKENEMGLVGWSPDGTDYTIEGMANLTGQSTESTSKDFGTYGNALDKVVLAIDALNDAGVYANAYNLTLNKAQYSELRASLSDNGISEWQYVMDALNEDGGNSAQILKSSDVTAATGFVTPVDPTGEFFQIYESYSPEVSFGFDSKLTEENSPIYGTLYERVGLDWKYPEAVCYLTNI